MPKSEPRREVEAAPMWSGLGLLLGAAIGIVLWRATDTVALFPVFVGVGLVFGLLIARFQESDRERD